jgi:hypothetical protein
MERYAATSELAASTTAEANTFPLGLVTGAGRVAQVYELIVGNKLGGNDNRLVAEIIRSTSALTPGTAITPEPLALGRGAAVSTVSSAPTGATLAAQPLLRLVFNGRATLRWAAVDPDARIIVPAGGGAGGNVLVANRQHSTTASLVLANQLFWAE